MYDHFNRKINYLRVSVTDRCNLRCVYCMPPEGVKLMHHDDILRFHEILEVIRVAVELGVNKIRLTGGEPLVRRGIIDLVKDISTIRGIEDFSMTTNGILLDDFAVSLKEAGLQRVNISLDTLDAARYRQITRIGDLKQVLKGIDAAIDAGLQPVKLNCVIQSSPEEPDAVAVKEFATARGLEARFIYQMDLEKGIFKPVIGGEGGHCARCNRLRLTSNGLIKPCLFSNNGYSVRELGAREAILQAVAHKPASGSSSSTHRFYNIGG
ncbi:MAG: radical SAM protein [Bacteroidales bacterium]|nr:radical SAM protein [Bacteroidales bacterium]